MIKRVEHISGSFGTKLHSGKIALAFLLGTSLAACQSSSLQTATEGMDQQAQNQVATALTPNPVGEVFGQGSVRISLLIPKTAPGNAATIANEVRNGALLAMKDFGEKTIQLVIKDTKGQAADAQGAATEAVSEGSTAILGPLFASSVSAASAVAKPNGKTIIAFSSDASVARQGVYLLGYTPQADTRRMLNYTLSLGKRSIYAFLANSPTGNLQEATLREVAGQSGANVQISKFERSGEAIEAAARAAAVGIASADTIYIPEGGQVPSAILSSLKRAGVDLAGKQIIGSGQWESVKFDDAVLEGALYTGRDISNFNNFASRYQTAYNAQPGVFAALGYDAVTLAASLVNNNGAGGAFTSASLEDQRGFAGINGIFRLKSDGTAERGLAVYKVSGGVGRIESPAPTSFSGS